MVHRPTPRASNLRLYCFVFLVARVFPRIQVAAEATTIGSSSRNRNPFLPDTSFLSYRSTIDRRPHQPTTTRRTIGACRRKGHGHPTSATATATAAFGVLPKFDETELWILRVASATASYFGLIAFSDRPRGRLDVDPNTCLDIRQSSVVGAGLGLYCTTTLQQGTVLGTYPGVVLPLNNHLPKLTACPQHEAYTWRFGDDEMVIDPTDVQGNIQPMVAGGNPSTFGSVWLFSTLLSFWQTPSTLCRINEPPIGRDVNVIIDEDKTNRCVIFSLCRDVYPGEEFFMDYGLNYDRSGYGPPPSSSSSSPTT